MASGLEGVIDFLDLFVNVSHGPDHEARSFFQWLVLGLGAGWGLTFLPVALNPGAPIATWLVAPVAFSLLGFLSVGKLLTGARGGWLAAYGAAFGLAFGFMRHLLA